MVEAHCVLTKKRDYCNGKQRLIDSDWLRLFRLGLGIVVYSPIVHSSDPKS